MSQLLFGASNACHIVIAIKKVCSSFLAEVEGGLVYNNNQIIIKVVQQEQRLARQRKHGLSNPRTQLGDADSRANEVKTQAAEATTNNEPRRAA